MLGKLTELGLSVSHAEGAEDAPNSRFLQVAKDLVGRTRDLKYLRIAPNYPPSCWIEMFSECAPVLSKLESLVIGG